MRDTDPETIKKIASFEKEDPKVINMTQIVDKVHDQLIELGGNPYGNEKEEQIIKIEDNVSIPWYERYKKNSNQCTIFLIC